MKLKRLYKAIDNDNFRYLEKKINSGLSVDFSDDEGYTLFHYAIFTENLVMANWLLEKGADINYMHNNGYTPFATACENCNLNIVKFLVENGCNLKPKGRYLPLHLAACFGRSEVINYLLDIGISIDEKDDNGTSYTPLHWATQEGRIDALKLLISRGAEINTHDEYFITPLRTAVAQRHTECVEYLLKKGALVEGHPRCVDSPLCAASSNGYLEIVKTLVEYGANVNFKDADRRTPIFYAKLNINSESKEIIEYLKEKGADTSIVDSYGYGFDDLDDSDVRSRIQEEI